MTISNTDDIIYATDVVSEVDKLESDIECNQDDYNENSEQIDDKEDELSELRERLDDLDEVKNASEISRIKNLIDEIRVDVKFLTDINTSIKADIEALRKELEPIQAFLQEFENYNNDDTLIHEDYFQTYAQQIAEDCGGDTREWPFCHIDWEAAAEALQMDYTCVDFDGETYYVR